MFGRNFPLKLEPPILRTADPVPVQMHWDHGKSSIPFDNKPTGRFIPLRNVRMSRFSATTVALLYENTVVQRTYMELYAHQSRTIRCMHAIGAASKASHCADSLLCVSIGKDADSCRDVQRSFL